MPTVAHRFHNLYCLIYAMETLKQANYALKTESIKNRTVYKTPYFCNYKISKKLGQHGKIVCQSCVKISEFYHTPVNYSKSSTGRKSLCFA